ncbi:hypothetical protein RUND412_009838, partial [Rhizina undulata]
EVMPATIGRGTKRKVAKKTVGPSKRSKRNAPIEPMDVDSMEVEQPEEELKRERKMNLLLCLSPRRVVVAVLLPLNPKYKLRFEISQPSKNTRDQES